MTGRHAAGPAPEPAKSGWTGLAQLALAVALLVIVSPLWILSLFDTTNRTRTVIVKR